MLKNSLGWGKQLWGKESAFFNLYLGTCLTAAAVATGYGLWNMATPSVVSAKTEQEEKQQQARHKSLEYTPLLSLAYTCALRCGDTTQTCLEALPGLTGSALSRLRSDPPSCHTLNAHL